VVGEKVKLHGNWPAVNSRWQRNANAADFSAIFNTRTTTEQADILGYARTKVIGSRTSFDKAFLRSSMQRNICI
jgi:hypothetical protein